MNSRTSGYRSAPRETKRSPFCWVCLLLIVFSQVRAQGAPAAADISLTVSVTPGVVLTPGSEGTLTLTFRNSGPADAVFVDAVSNFYPAFGPGQKFALFPVAETAPCQAFFDDLTPTPGNPVLLSADVIVGELSANQSITCRLGIFVWPDATGAFDLTFTIGIDSRFNVDPNLADNSVTLPLTFFRPAQVVPTLGPFLSIALGVLILGTTAWSNRRANQKSANRVGNRRRQ